MPTNDDNTAILKAKNGKAVALKGVKVRGRLQGLMAEVEVEQSYTNPQNTNIEAVYTFPLPVGAVLLALEVEIAGQKLAGNVVERKKAERNYEDAVTDGNSAIMLSATGSGLYTASLGNLMAGESAVIRYRYGLMLSWQGSKLRFLLPTTIAPRYGNAEAAGLLPHEIPSSSLDVEYPLDLCITLCGKLGSAKIACPSHLISTEQVAEGVVVRLERKAYLDRDFVLTLESDAVQSSCTLAPDRDQYVALASLRVPPAPHANDRPLALKIVIDCSGSMAGTSIDQARKAAREILNQLRPQDYFNITLFGNESRHLFKSMVPASEQSVTKARSKLERMDADMGGTEMQVALNSAFGLGGAECEASLLLITDGEIYEYEKLVKQAQKSNHRIFVGGVGASVAEAFLKSLAETTGGACELVAPQEGMAERVLSQFHRMRQPKISEVALNWPVPPLWHSPLPGTIFAGDTLHVFAGFETMVAGEVKMLASGASELVVQVLSSNEPEIPRMAAAKRLEGADAADGLLLALDYQLLSPWTNLLVVAERESKADDLPEIQQIPQMLAADWGGAGSSRTLYGAPSSASCAPAFYSFEDDDDILMESSNEVDCSVAGPEDEYPFVEPTPVEFIAAIEASFTEQPSQWTVPNDIYELLSFGIAPNVLMSLQNHFIIAGHEKTVVAFLYALTESSIGDTFGRAFKRAILKAWKQLSTGDALDTEMSQSLAAISREDWNWKPSAPSRATIRTSRATKWDRLKQFISQGD